LLPVRVESVIDASRLLQLRPLTAYLHDTVTSNTITLRNTPENNP